jgi:dihydropteroate synthase
VSNDRWVHRGGTLSLEAPVIMGVLNITPDSFSDGGMYLDPGEAAERGSRMVADGAMMIDVGGESTRPGSTPIDVATELRRVLPVIETLRARVDVPISIDTRRAEVAEAAIAAGADIVNDVSALRDPGMRAVVAGSGAGLVLMHMRGDPRTMQDDPRYVDVVSEVGAELRGRVDHALDAGIDPDRIVVDPGIGFGKTFRHNFELIARLREIVALGRPVVLGASRKAFLGAVLGGAPPAERAVATASACVAALFNGARIFRVHDVRTVRDALLVAEAIRTAAAPTA